MARCAIKGLVKLFIFFDLIMSMKTKPLMNPTSESNNTVVVNLNMITQGILLYSAIHIIIIIMYHSYMHMCVCVHAAIEWQ